MLDFFHNNLWVAVLLGVAALLIVGVWGFLDQRRELAQRTGTWRVSKPTPPTRSDRSDR